jgi:hypothetical protein
MPISSPGACLGSDRQAKGEQRIDSAFLGRLDSDPALSVACHRQIRNGLVERTGTAEDTARLGHPVAAALACVDASRRAGVRQGKGASAGIIEDKAAAIQALRILEIETRLTLRATKKSHRPEIVELAVCLAHEAVGVGNSNRIVPIVFEKCTAPTQ